MFVRSYVVADDAVLGRLPPCRATELMICNELEFILVRYRYE